MVARSFRRRACIVTKKMHYSSSPLPSCLLLLLLLLLVHKDRGLRLLRLRVPQADGLALEREERVLDARRPIALGRELLVEVDVVPRLCKVGN